MRNPFWNWIGKRFAVDKIKKKAMLITPEQLDTVTTTLTKDRCAELAGLLNAACDRYGVKAFDEFDEFLANLLQESLECNHKTENMNYQAQTLANTFPSRYSKTKTKPYIPNDKAVSLAHRPEQLANDVYGGRMGNNQPGDGWRFRGGGYIGLTGRETYGKYAAYIGKEIGEAADLVRSQDYYALDSAFWFFYVLKGLKDESIRDEFIGIVKSINGGTIGLKDRQFYYERIKALK
jgi:putative chitinase